MKGTRSLLEAARLAGVERAVMTSSSATVGPLRGGRLATESDWAEVRGGHGYHASKVLQERAALRANLPVVTVLPTAPIGPRDARPTPTGQIVVDVMRGRIPAYLDGAMNLVAVEDVGRAHVLALERGHPGERYLVGGQNLSLAEVMGLFARHAGTRPPAWRMPYPVALTAALVRRGPLPPLAARRAPGAPGGGADGPPPDDGAHRQGEGRAGFPAHLGRGRRRPGGDLVPRPRLRLSGHARTTLTPGHPPAARLRRRG